MGVGQALEFEKGKSEIIRAVEGIVERPILVGIYGLPNSGKSYLIRELGDYFNIRGLAAGCHGGAPCKSFFEDLKSESQFSYSLQLFHCAWERFEPFNGRSCLLREDPQRLSKIFLNRDLDLSVGIYNPNFYRHIAGKYDIVISNPDSVKKKFS